VSVGLPVVPGINGGAARRVISALIVDDHEIARRGLRDLLESSGEIVVVGEASTAAEALAWAADHDADVAVLDVRLPDGNGIEVCRELHSMRPSMRCLMLTSFDDDQAIVAAHLAGAAGYVLKQARCADLLGTVLRVASGVSLLDPRMVARVRERLGHPDVTDPLLNRLTRQEHRVLQLIAAGESNRCIAHDMGIAEKTVKNYVSNVLMKLGMSHRTEAAVYAVRHAGSRGGM
jgi:two-component system, NarL family, response regulator DevR